MTRRCSNWEEDDDDSYYGSYYGCNAERQAAVSDGGVIGLSLTALALLSLLL